MVFVPSGSFLPTCIETISRERWTAAARLVDEAICRALIANRDAVPRGEVTLF
jgi:hypothetical protein